ncbi:MAG TPA: NAD(P)H-dependent oxidoreductase [Burkholderiaceae bacterium]|nr:NAD(P)H-dependent oxidoreductase [Burkholderiaceae bacterium]
MDHDKPLTVLAIAGSARQGAYSVRLRDAARRAVEQAGAEASVLDLRALGLPLYDGDLEAGEGVPAGAATLRDAIVAHDALLLVTPEYNWFPTPLELNAFDWLSRLKDGLAATADKPVALLSSSPGPFGGMRALALMRQFLGGVFRMAVQPTVLSVPRAAEAFADEGTLSDPKAAAALQAAVQALLREAARRRAVP